MSTLLDCTLKIVFIGFVGWDYRLDKNLKFRVKVKSIYQRTVSTYTNVIYEMNARNELLRKCFTVPSGKNVSQKKSGVYVPQRQ